MAPFKSFAKVAFTIAAPKASINNNNNNIDDPTKEYGSLCLTKMCKLFNITPNNNLYLSNNNKSGERGVCITNSIKEGEVILSIPISSCFRDDEPPNWYNNNKQNENEEVDTVGERYNPSAWSTRLAASILDMELNQGRESSSSTTNTPENEELKLGREIWSSMLPQNDILRASLPVHWDEEVLSTSKCTALELAVDSAYFARANSVMDLSEELKAALDVEGWSMMNNDDVKELLLDMDALQRKCHDALDIVQTRACRVERKCDDGVTQWGPPIRILAPIFDFINHGSFSKGSGNAIYGIENANFDLEDAKLVVRATRDLTKGEEVLIDYGDSARPAWKALTSYGFVPEYDENTCVAELFMHGQRFEVDTQSVPFDLVEVAAAQSLLDQSYEDGEIEQVQSGDSGLPPFVARAIVKRATEAAFNLVTEPDEESDNTEDDFEPGSLLAMNLATNLRWSQHKVLMGFAENLKEFASSTTSVEEE